MTVENPDMLRQIARHMGECSEAGVCRDAADEIERMRAALRSTYGDLQHYVAHGPESAGLVARLFDIGRLLRDVEQSAAGEEDGR